MKAETEQAIRAIAFHLPQYHPVPENDEWWGKGFTEWTNVVQAKPRFPGHYQPHLPADLGFYDLRLPETRAAQAELAAAYGIGGFCYFHYWFHGRQILELPVNEMWKSGEPDFPFCLCWANESWSRRWDGSDDELLIEQRFSPEDDLAHIRALIPMFEDPRYIRVEGRPFFAVYRSKHLPEPRRTTDIWRREAERAGLKGLFLARVESHIEYGDPREMGFDCGLEFQPRWSVFWTRRMYRRKWWHRHKLGTGEFAFRDNTICQYKDLVEAALESAPPDYPRIPCVCPGWDNSARRKNGAVIFVDSTPQLYERWLTEVVKQQQARLAANGHSGMERERLVFINAWNEWAEGNHLEPDQRWGHAYLEATKRALGLAGSEGKSGSPLGQAGLAALMGARSERTALRAGGMTSRDAAGGKMPGVSVIVPNYNHAKFLRKRIDSILAQTYPDFELILLDDASTDESREILREYAKDARVTIEFNEVNSGSPFKQWNKGVRLARGEYIWIAESDDYAEPRFVERMIAALEADPETTFAYCRSRRTTAEDRVDGFADYNLPDPERWTRGFCVDGRELCEKYFALITPIPNASSVVFRKQAYERVGGADETLRLCGDWKVWAAMALEGKVAYVSEPLNYFRYHANTARGSTERDGVAAKEFLDVSRWVLEQVSMPEAEVDRIRRARAEGWVPAVLSFRTPAGLRREILESVRALDPRPYRWFLRPAMRTLRRKMQRHWPGHRSAENAG